MKTKTYGLMIERENPHGTEYVTATVMAREDDSAYPVGTSGVFYSWEDSHAGLTFDGLKMRGHFYDGCDGIWRLSGFELGYYDVYCIEQHTARAMLKTLTKVNKRIEYDGSTEPGDILKSVCDALRLKWIVERTANLGSNWSDSDWHWLDVGDGRRRLRSMIEEAKPKEAEAA